MPEIINYMKRSAARPSGKSDENAEAARQVFDNHAAR
jgi:hypothetical protein